VDDAVAGQEVVDEAFQQRPATVSVLGDCVCAVRGPPPLAEDAVVASRSELSQAAEPT
jgi:hypothetical protein